MEYNKGSKARPSDIQYALNRNKVKEGKVWLNNKTLNVSFNYNKFNALRK